MKNLSLDSVGVSAKLFHLLVIIASFNGHFIVFALQPVYGSLASNLFIFGMPLGSLELVVSIGQLLLNPLAVTVLFSTQNLL